MRPEECPFFRSPIWPTARVLRGFQKAGGPPFLDMRPSDVGRRLSLHVQSPPPIALNIQVPAAPGVSSARKHCRWSALKHCGQSLVPFPFKKVVSRIYLRRAP